MRAGWADTGVGSVLADEEGVGAGKGPEEVGGAIVMGRRPGPGPVVCQLH